MNRYLHGSILALLGTVLLRLALSGGYLDYVRAGMRPYLLATGALFVLLGIGTLLGRGDAHAHTHPAAWLLCLPVFLALAVPPPALGSYTAARGGATVRQPAPRTTYPPLPTGSPVALAVRDYATRATWDHGRTLTGRTIRLTGFVTPGTGQAWYVARLHIVCCAADALTALVEVDTDRPAPVRDTWITVTGTWLPSTDPDPARAVPRLAATTIRDITRPTDPYE